MTKPIKKLLWVGFNQIEMRKAFDKVADFIYVIHRTDKNVNDLGKLIIEAQKQHKFDVAFFQLQGEKMIVPPLIINQLRGKGTFCINWTGDVRTPLPQWFLDCGKAYNVSLFSNARDILIMQKAGHNADYFQIGFDPEIYRPDAKPGKAYDIVYMANRYGHFGNSKMRVGVSQALIKKYGNRYGLFGSGWQESGVKPTGNLMNDPHGEASIYAGCKIALNISNEVLPRYTSDRIFRIMGSGAFCLAQNYPDIEMEFVRGEHLDTFESLADMTDLTEAWLADDKGRKEVAKAGCDHVHKYHSWDARMKDLIEIWEKYK